MYKEISLKTSIPEWKVKNTLQLVNDENTVHFITRYRKEATGNLDEEQIRLIIELNQSIIKLIKAKENAIKNISEQNKLTPNLKSQIETAKIIGEVEDIYAPFKRTKKTKADIAIKKGFLPLAIQLKKQNKYIISNTLKQYSKEEIKIGVQDILNQEIADNPNFKKRARTHFLRLGIITSKSTKKEHEQKNKFKIYESFSINISKIKSHQILAINRGENLKIISVKIEYDKQFFEDSINKYSNQNYTYLKEGCKKIFKSIENELRKELTAKAVKSAMIVFQNNLKQLLMLKPHYGTNILAIDPGFRTGCKICTIDKYGNAKNFTKIYLHKKSNAIEILKNIIQDKIVIVGNGTGSKETCELLAKQFPNDVIVVNESGASVYSTSKAGQEEFPNLDATDRGTISIGKRYIDCLSELVKIPIISIGVGLYQHDMPPKELEEKLKITVENVVNIVGININTASTYLLNYVSGLTKTTAKKIFKNKPYKSRQELSKILSAKTYQQSIGFLRLPNSKEELDNTSIHPEEYDLAKEIIAIKNIQKLKNKFPKLSIQKYNEIIEQHELAGKEIRDVEGNKSNQKHLDINEIQINDIVKGIVRNITPFGAFIDIGLKNDGLVHISELANKFVKDPNEVISVGEELKIKILNIDLKTGKIQLSLKQV